jgi:tRNA pseudouridine38-40 synthase
VRTLKLTLAYDGSAYAGWQVQSGQATLQDELEKALATITGEQIRVTASGRTDAGVHALGQVVSFHTNSQLAPDVFLRALNTELPRDMSVLSSEEARPGFHATCDAVRKRYRYIIDDGRYPDVFRRFYSWHTRHRLNSDLMHQAAQTFLGKHDFRSFETNWPSRTSSIRTVFDSIVMREGHIITFEVEADGFLYNMVRAMTGTLVDVGSGRRSVTWPAEVLAAGDRRLAGMTAPPQGLFLVSVDYE